MTFSEHRTFSYLILSNTSKISLINLCKSHFYLKIADYQQSSPFNQSINPPIHQSTQKQSGIQKLYIKIENTEVLSVISNPPVIYSKFFKVLKFWKNCSQNFFFCKCPSAKTKIILLDISISINTNQSMPTNANQY